jgi:hypothetical protein
VHPPSKGLAADGSLWDFPSNREPVTVKPCKDCSRCSQQERQGGGFCCCACARLQCWFTTVPQMQLFQWPDGRLPEHSYSLEHSALEHLPRSPAAFRLCWSFSSCWARMSPTHFDGGSHSASLRLSCFWDQEHFRLIPVYSDEDSLSTPTPSRSRWPRIEATAIWLERGISVVPYGGLYTSLEICTVFIKTPSA